MVQVGPNDIPYSCNVCRAMTLHRIGPDGQPHCLTCMMRQMPAAPPQAHRYEAPRQRASGGGVMLGTIKLAGFIVALVFLLCLGMCVYVCGSAAKATSSTNSGR